MPFNWNPFRRKPIVQAPVTPPPAPVYVTLATSDEAASKAEYRGTKVPRINKETLELNYCRDPVVFAGVNWISALTGANGYDLEGKDSDKKAVQEFLDRLRFEAWVKRIANNLAIYGDAFCEIIPNKDKTIISGLYVIDPKSMDFSKKKATNNVDEVYDLDAYGKPKFFVQHPYDWDGTMNAGKQFKPKEILQLGLRGVSDSLWHMGIVETISRITNIKWNIEQAMGEAIYKIGFPVPTVEAGDELHQPSANDIDKLAYNLKGFDNKKTVVLAYYNKLKDPPATGQFIGPTVQALEYCINEQIAGIGIPKPVVMGLGEGSNRATLEQLTDIGARNIESIHRAIEEGLNEMVFKQMEQLNQIAGPVTIKFKPLKVEEKFTKLTAIVDLINAGVLTTEPEFEDWVREYLELPERVGEYQPMEPIDKVAGQFGANIADEIRKSKPY
jgi:hypothetical protein